jgi:DnaJ-class molecular chaperone
MDEASSVFGVEKEILSSMSKRSLVRLFRRLAQKRHPDKGGTHEEFIRLTEAYRECLRSKGG